MKKAICVVFALLMMVVMAVPALAAQPPTTSTMDVTMVIKGDDVPQTAEDYTIQVVPVSESNPMPTGSADGVYQFTITGADTERFSITFDQVGDYQYRVSQIKGSNKSCTYDQTVYLVTFQVRNAMKEDGTIDGNANFTITAIARPVLSGSVTEDGVNMELGDKCDILFTNKYPTTSDSPQTGDEANPILYIVLIAASLGVIVALILTHKTRTPEE